MKRGFKMIKIIRIILVAVSLLLISCDFTGEIRTYELVSLKDNRDIHGSFFLGTGSISQNSYYYYYYKDTLGFIKMYKTGCEDECKIKYIDTNKTKPYVTHQFTSVGGNWFTQIIFYIPESSIKNDFELDLEEIDETDLAAELACGPDGCEVI